MKKLLFLFVVVSMCYSTLSAQVPPQTLIVNQNCDALLPNYYTLLNGITASDNCGQVTIVQYPIAGTVITFATPTLEVKMVAKDAFGNTSDTLKIPVVLIDTIKPTLIWNGGNIAFDERAVGYLWKNLLAHTDEAIAHFLVDWSWTQGMPLADTTAIVESMHWMTYNHRVNDTIVDLYRQYLAQKDSIQ